MNKLIQTVTLGGDPVIKTSKDGKSVASFSGAVRKRFVRDGESDVDWFNYVAFGATADFISKYFKKGSKALIDGEPHNNNYTKDDGTKVYRDQITINNIEFFGKKSDGEMNADSAPAAPAENTTPNKAESAPATSSYDEYDDF